jgi:CheY-like chemotaxis protein
MRGTISYSSIIKEHYLPNIFNEMSKVLVIEDNIEISENIVEILELADYDVLWPNGKQGVEMATMNLPDIILSDIMMPDLDGYGVLYLLNKIQKPQLFRLFYYFKIRTS